MMSAATAGCGSGGSDEYGIDDDDYGDVEATSINNQSINETMMMMMMMTQKLIIL
jgi:hypothetical protein